MSNLDGIPQDATEDDLDAILNAFREVYIARIYQSPSIMLTVFSVSASTGNCSSSSFPRATSSKRSLSSALRRPFSLAPLRLSPTCVFGVHYDSPLYSYPGFALALTRNWQAIADFTINISVSWVEEVKTQANSPVKSVTGKRAEVFVA